MVINFVCMIVSSDSYQASYLIHYIARAEASVHCCGKGICYLI